MAGLPDRIILAPGGVVFFVEFKREGETLRPAQLFWKRRLEKLGFRYYVSDHKDTNVQILQAEGFVVI